MKKVILFLLTFAMIISLFTAITITAGANVSIPLSSKEQIIGDAANHKAIQVKYNEVHGHYFETDKPLAEYRCRCPSYGDGIGSITMTLYKWAGSYDATVASEPVVSKTYTNFADNSYLPVFVPDEKRVSGAFLVTLSNPSQAVGVWKAAGVNAEYTAKGLTSACYKNGVLGENEAFDSCYRTSETNFLVDTVSRANRSAYSRIQMEDYDGCTSQMYNGTTYIYVNNTGALGYADINFSTTAPKGITLNINQKGCADGDTCEIQVFADNPYSGTKLCELYYEYNKQTPVWENLNGKITQSIKGVHDIYFIISGRDFNIDWFTFTKTVPADSIFEERLKNFVPVPDSELKYNYSDTWSATDMMGRKLPGYETVGERDPERQIGMFYWTWHANQGRIAEGPPVCGREAVLKEYLRKNPGGTEADIKNAYTWTNADGTTGSWDKGGAYWNESIYGFYHGLDTWVMRKQLELFAAAGVDALFFDATNNALTWTGGYMALAGQIHDMRQKGIKAPQISFILPFSTNENTAIDLRRIYQSMYGTGLYSDTWYYWDGKPVLMAYPEYLDIETAYSDINELNRTIRNFFTFRPSQPSYFDGPLRSDQWPWLEVYPQHGFVPTTGKYNYECVSVGIAQNADDYGLTAMNGDGVYGRSYTYHDRFAHYAEPYSKFYGYNFQEQWERAFELNPKMVFVTGWNEWTAGRYDEWYRVIGAFPDTYRDEYSRDIEPTKGDFKDNYYYQLASNIRRFKGVSRTPAASAEKAILIGGSFNQWADVGPEYIGYEGGTETRDFYGTGHIRYFNDTGRNDIVLSKVARDSDNLYFYVKTKDTMTDYTDPNWMRLYINTDRKYKTGWEGYDYVINRVSPASSTSAVLEHSVNGWKWENVCNVTFRKSGNEMMIKVPRDALGLENRLVDIEFKWNDNGQLDGDIMDFYTSGDTAPVGRYAYRYTETTANDKTPENEPLSVPEIKLNQYKNAVILSLDDHAALVNGKLVRLESDPGVCPMLIEGKTMIPLRCFAEYFGANVSWNDKTSTAVIHQNGNTVEITVNKPSMIINGQPTALSASPRIIRDRVFVPFREIAEALGQKVLWVEGNNDGLIIACQNPETVHSFEWVGDLTEDIYKIR